jgi:hypothetical protein
MRRCSLLVVVLLFLINGSVQAATITIDSVPKGAQVCLKKSGAPQCYGMTPLQIDVDFATDNESKRFLVKKIGYQIENKIVAANDRALQITLKRRDIFFEPKRHVTPELEQLQKEVNTILGRLIYESTSPIGALDTELVGKIRLESVEQKFALHVGLLITNAERRRELGSVRRKHESNERNTLLARVVLQGEGIELLNYLADALAPISAVHEIVLSIDYVKAGAVLADESVHFFHTSITRQYEKISASGAREHWVESTTLSNNLEVSKVEDELEIRTVLVSISLDKLGQLGKQGREVDAVLDNATVFVNDNRSKIFTRVESH